MYRKLQFDKKYRDTLRRLLSSSFKIGPSGKLEPMNPKGAITHPWVFTNYDARRKYCNHWNHIYCGEFGIIPTFCRYHCWKTVVYPRTVYELFQLSDILRTLNLPSKCGLDRRPYTYRAWGGYIYGDSLEQGREYYAQTRSAVSTFISPEVPIILKRGCTEMERLRPSNEWDDHSKEEKELEFQLDDLFRFEEIDFRQSAWLIRDIKEGWILRAIEIADPTVPRALHDFSNGITLSDLTVTSFTYHDKPSWQPPRKRNSKGRFTKENE